MATLRIACIQMTSTDVWQDNLALALGLMEKALAHSPRLLVLPENALLFHALSLREFAQSEASNDALQAIKKFAQEHSVYVLLGSHPMLRRKDGSEVEQGRVRQSSLLFSDQGDLVARYDKIHLFDVMVADKMSRYQESRYIEPGEVDTCITSIDGVKVGLTICYDLRFPELYRRLSEQGAEVVTVPSAFTYRTGEAHWHTLLKARAIENQYYVTGVDQVGWHNSKRQTYGHSVAYSPWGEALDSLGDTEMGVLVFDVDSEELNRVRLAMPCLEHRRIT